MSLPRRSLSRVYPPDLHNRGAMGPWALGQPPVVPMAPKGSLWLLVNTGRQVPATPGGGPWHPLPLGGGRYSHEGQFIVNVLVIC